MKTISFLIVLTAVHLSGATMARADESYVAHEWGTFTSVQGADGVQLEWNPLTVSELPRFVHEAKPRGSGLILQPSSDLGAKSIFRTLQRMETPVIYFYSEREQTIDVTVKFPQGYITEWYPQRVLTPATNAKPVPTNMLPNSIQWPKVQVFPRRRHEELASRLPIDHSGSHYYAARETESDFLAVTGKDPAAGETEKFLFYRGIGNFRGPLTVTQSGENAETIILSNPGPFELRHLFAYVVRGKAARFVFVPELPPGASRPVSLSSSQGLASLAEVRTQLAAEMEEALVSEGLFRSEAHAMVKTWDDSWFTESGVRVLYTLPRSWTDRILPLTLEPKPREIARVMVGRAELITPSMEWELMRQIVHYSEADPTSRQHAIEATRQIGLGRFLEPAARRLMARLPYQQLNVAADELLHAATKTEAKKELAAK